MPGRTGLGDALLFEILQVSLRGGRIFPVARGVPHPSCLPRQHGTSAPSGRWRRSEPGAGVGGEHRGVWALVHVENDSVVTGAETAERAIEMALNEVALVVGEIGGGMGVNYTTGATSGSSTGSPGRAPSR